MSEPKLKDEKYDVVDELQKVHEYIHKYINSGTVRQLKRAIKNVKKLQVENIELKEKLDTIQKHGSILE